MNIYNTCGIKDVLVWVCKFLYADDAICLLRSQIFQANYK